MKKIYLIDVSSMFFRAFYAIRPLSSPAGVPVNAIYGFLSMVTKLLKEEKPEYMAFCYDRKEPSFRKSLYQEYKANRSEMPADLEVQMPYIKKIAGLLGIKALEVDSFEADDLIGTMARIGFENKFEVIIVSGDKDFGQLIKPHIYLYDTMKEVRYDVDGVKQKWGVRPDQFIDFLALVGDSSDNIPGVAGIGPKGAIKLLEQFKNIEDIYERIDSVESKSIKEKLILSKENAFLSKKLVTIVLDVPLSSDMNDYRLQPMQREPLRNFLQELNFKTFEKNLIGLEPVKKTEDESITELEGDLNSKADSEISAAGLPLDPQNLNSQNRESQNKESWPPSTARSTPNSKAAISLELHRLDVETTLEMISNHCAHQGTTHVEIYFFQDERGFYLLFGAHVIAVATINDQDFHRLGLELENRKIIFSGFDLKQTWHRLGCESPKSFWDSMLAAYVINASDCSDFSKVYKHFLLKELPNLASPEETAVAHLELRAELFELLKKDGSLEIYNKFENPLVEILYKMERKGIRVDPSILKLQSQQLEVDLKQLEKKIHELAGEVFNIASPKQLGVILFDKLKLPPSKKTKTGYSTDNDVLVALEHPIAKEVLEYRELAKLKSTYVDALPQLIHSEDGRVHTSFNQALTATGRLSSTSPNLQNIPIRTRRGQMVRQAFVADGDSCLLSVDYSQIELRILAHISEDPNMIKSFQEDLDIHTATAAEIYGVPLEAVTTELRRNAKAVNFGIAYGQGAFGLAENLGIPRKEAQGIIDRYFERFKNVRTYIDSTTQRAHEKGYVETLFGRRRYIHELKAKNGAIRKFGERAAINAPIQGTASDIVKLAMIEIDKSVAIPMLLQVHDELIFEAKKEVLETHSNVIKRVMENVIQLKVPLKVNLAIGKNWDEAH